MDNKEKIETAESTTEQAVDEKEKKGEEMVTIPLKEYADQLKSIDELTEKNEEYSDGWQRERADFDNYRKRIQRDQDILKENLHVEIIKNYLFIHDDMERALKNAPQSKESQEWIKGLDLILQKMNNMLAEKGITPIEVQQEVFDPNKHEAISHEENPDFESGQIIEVVQKGYKIGDRVIRPAQVRVAK